MTIIGWVIILGIVLAIGWGVTRTEAVPELPAENIAPPRCQAKNRDGELVCPRDANRGHVRFVRPHPFWEFIQRLFGAPPRWRVSENRYTRHYCESHYWEAFERCHHMLATEEQARVTALRDAERRLSAYERNELDRELSQ